nr:hypothetical protein [Desulfobacula sp.]
QTGSVTYNLYFSGYRNVEEDALGHGTVYRYDRKKRLIAVENTLGHATRTGYDGRNSDPSNHCLTVSGKNFIAIKGKRFVREHGSMLRGA